MSLGERISRLVPADEESDSDDEGEEVEESAAPWDGKQAAREIAQLIVIYSKGTSRLSALLLGAR